MNSAPLYTDVNPQTFQTEVVERSQRLPVVLLLWTDQAQPAVDTRNTLERLAGAYQGKFALALCDVARHPVLAQQLRISAIPSLRVVQGGKITGQLEGPQGEGTLRQLLDQLTLSSGDKLREQLSALIEAEDWDRSSELIQQALSEEPNNPLFKVEWADVLVLRGDLDEARKVIATIPEGTTERERPASRLELAEEALGMGSISDAAERIERDAGDLEAWYMRSVLLVTTRRRYAEALDNAMHILKTDRTFREDIGRTTMIRIMSLLPKDSPLSQHYRQMMFGFMH